MSDLPISSLEMEQLLVKSVMAPAQQASNILKAWVLWDESAIRREVQEGLNLCSSSGAQGLEEESVELLRTVVGRLNDCPDLLDAVRADPVVRLCINLLIHLANQSDRQAFAPKPTVTYRH